MTHTPEPWKSSGAFLETADGTRFVSDSISPEDARRIVACVNLLADVPTQVLEDLAESTKNLPPCRRLHWLAQIVATISNQMEALDQSALQCKDREAAATNDN